MRRTTAQPDSPASPHPSQQVRGEDSAWVTGKDGLPPGEETSSSERRRGATSRCLQQSWPSTFREFLERAEFSQVPKSAKRVFGNTKRAHARTHSRTHTHTHTSRTPLRYHSNALAEGPLGDTDRMTPTPSPDSLIYGDHPLLPGPGDAGSSDAIVQGRLTVISNVWLGGSLGSNRDPLLPCCYLTSLSPGFHKENGNISRTSLIGLF